MWLLDKLEISLLGLPYMELSISSNIGKSVKPPTNLFAS